MKASVLEYAVKEKEEELRVYIRANGVNKCSERIRLHHNDISGWINNKRAWSYNKILEVAHKLGL